MGALMGSEWERVSAQVTLVEHGRAELSSLPESVPFEDLEKLIDRHGATTSGLVARWLTWWITRFREATGVARLVSRLTVQLRARDESMFGNLFNLCGEYEVLSGLTREVEEGSTDAVRALWGQILVSLDGSRMVIADAVLDLLSDEDALRLLLMFPDERARIAEALRQTCSRFPSDRYIHERANAVLAVLDARPP